MDAVGSILRLFGVMGKKDKKEEKLGGDVGKQATDAIEERNKALRELLGNDSVTISPAARENK